MPNYLSETLYKIAELRELQNSKIKFLENEYRFLMNECFSQEMGLAQFIKYFNENELLFINSLHTIFSDLANNETIGVDSVISILISELNDRVCTCILKKMNQEVDEKIAEMDVDSFFADEVQMDIIEPSPTQNKRKRNAEDNEPNTAIKRAKKEDDQFRNFLANNLSYFSLFPDCNLVAKQNGDLRQSCDKNGFFRRSDSK